MSAVLLVEDEQHLAVGLQFNLEAEGYEVEIAPDGETALALLARSPNRFDAVVLDVMLPGKDGFEVASELRQAGRFVPILMLTARNRPEDVLRGFEAGADDYLPKPFELAILLARLRGLLRRREWFHLTQNPAEPAPATSADVFTFAGKTIDFSNLELHAGDRTVKLTLMEAELLRYLIRHEGKASREHRRLIEFTLNKKVDWITPRRDFDLLLTTADYVAGMTDSYALKIFRHMTGSDFSVSR